jgi:hypothetical protein
LPRERRTDRSSRKSRPSQYPSGCRLVEITPERNFCDHSSFDSQRAWFRGGMQLCGHFLAVTAFSLLCSRRRRPISTRHEPRPIISFVSCYRVQQLDLTASISLNGQIRSREDACLAPMKETPAKPNRGEPYARHIQSSVEKHLGRNLSVSTIRRYVKLVILEGRT